jgi:hypothetical protein
MTLAKDGVERGALPVEIAIPGTRPIAPARAPSATAFDDPLQHAHVLAEAGPREFAVAVLAKPVDAEDARRMRDRLAHREPMLEIIADVIAAEGQHRKRIAAHFADGAGGCRRRFRSHGGGLVHALFPRVRLAHQRQYRNGARRK